jgi:dihydroorotate dehydrogenase
MNLFKLFQSFAFRQDPEKIHDLSLKMFKYFPQLSSCFNTPKLSDKYHYHDGHMQWDFPVGLAAGFDKNAMALDFFARLGFGAVEIGTVTKKPQDGNAKPRIWRHEEIASLTNAMGFPNLGHQIIRQNILNTSHSTCLGVNIGKNKETQISETPSEYAYLYEYFAHCADYITINISSPNTPGLRSLQNKDALKEILVAVSEKRKDFAKPLYLKIAPDLEKEALYDLVDLSKEFQLSGIIATNTTIQHSFGSGGASGQYLKELSNKARTHICQAAKETPSLSIIGVGGIDSFADIHHFWKMGGSFVQIYTAFIYQGPQLLTDIQNEIDKLLLQSGTQNITEYLKSLK